MKNEEIPLHERYFRYKSYFHILHLHIFTFFLNVFHNPLRMLS